MEFTETEKNVSLDQIKELESKLNFEFPLEYLEHLMKYNGGRCKPNVFYFYERGKLTNSSVDWFLAIHEGEFDNLEDYFLTYKVEEKRIPESFFPIAHDPGGNLICMDNRDCKIYFWDHERESIGDNYYLISDNLNSFLNELKVD